MVMARRSVLVVTLALLLAALGNAPALAKQLRGPITGVIGRGEEGGTGGSGNGELSNPSGVAIDTSAAGNEDVYVVDRGNNRVEKFSATGAYLSQFNGSTTPEGSFSSPTAVAVDKGTGDVYVVDTGHNVVDEFNANGEYVCELSGVERGCVAHPAEPPTFSVPIGVAVDPTSGGPTSGDVYVSDKENRIVDVFSSTGADVRQFHPGARPWGLAVDLSGDVFVALAGEGRIKEFTPGGESELGAIGPGAHAVGVDLQSGNIFVGAEIGGSGGPYGVEEFNPSRSELSSFGAGLMSQPGLSSPGLAENATTKAVYATDQAGNVVDIFGLVTIPDPNACTATAIGATSATLQGEVNPRATKAEFLFQYGTESSYGLETPLALVGGGAEVEVDVPVEASVTELIPGTTYHCRLRATNATGLFNDGTDSTFTTLPLPPVANEAPAYATEITTEGAILNGLVNPGNGSTVYHFAYGEEAGSYPHALPTVGIGAGFEAISVEQAIPSGSLAPGTTYHFALTASNSSGTVTGPDEIFTTPSNGAPSTRPPLAETGPAESIGQNTATVSGTVDPEGLITGYRIDFGLDAHYGTVVSVGNVGSGDAAVAVSQALSGLQPGTTYHYRIVAFSAAGTTSGGDRSFTTSILPAGIFQPGTPGLVPVPVFPRVSAVIEHQKKKKKKKHVKQRRRPKHGKGRRL
jgi:hypothetical protein